MLQAPIRIYEDARKRSIQGKDSRLPHGMSREPESDRSRVDEGAPQLQPPRALLVADAGEEDANGIYHASASSSSSSSCCGAPVYRHQERAEYQVRRDEQTNPRSGKKKHGWLLSGPGGPLYGVPTASHSVPEVGWRAFSAPEQNAPSVKACQLLAEAFILVSDASQKSGNEAFQQQDWARAQAEFTAGLEALACSGERFGEAFEGRAAQLFAGRARASCHLRQFRAALRDSVAALEICPCDASAKAAAIDAAICLGCDGEADALELLQVAGSGEILDRCAPLSLKAVERWVEEVAHVAEARAAFRSAPPEPIRDGGTEADFEAASQFQGARRGFAFRTGDQGLGYYRDVVSGASAEADSTKPEQQSPVEMAGIKALEDGEVTPLYHRCFTAWVGFPRATELESNMLQHEWTLWLGKQLSPLNWRLMAKRKGVDVTAAPDAFAGEEPFHAERGPLSPRSQQRWAVERLAAAFE
ncbi:unnamed protein product, partial [Polarella glacialis]